MSTERIILSNLQANEQFSRKVLPYLSPEYFSEQNEKTLFLLIEKYYADYNRAPSKKELEIELQNLDKLSEETYKASIETLDGLEVAVVDNLDWLEKTTEKWCQDRALYNALLKAIEIQDDKTGKYERGSIPKILTDALAISFDTHIGHDYLDDAADRWDFYHKLEKKVPFDLEFFNKITKGGLPSKTMSAILCPTGGGKSQFMCHLSAAYLSQGYNVLYITLEMSEEKIAERIDANLLNFDIGLLPSLKKDDFVAKVQRIKDKTKGKLIVKEYPNGTAHSGHWRYLINDLKLKKGFVPDILVVDYLGISASSRLKRGAGMYEYGKSVSEEFRALCQECDLVGWTAYQTNRAGIGNSEIDLTNTAESMGGPHTCDLLFAMVQPESLVELNQMLIIQLKNRYNDLNDPKKFVIGVDKAMMKFYDTEERSQKDISEGPVFDKTPSGMKDKFGGFM